MLLENPRSYSNPTSLSPLSQSLLPLTQVYHGNMSPPKIRLRKNRGEEVVRDEDTCVPSWTGDLASRTHVYIIVKTVRMI